MALEVDQDLLKACQRGERRAQSDLYRRCFSVLMGICMRYMGGEEEALAILNMGFLKILNNLHRRKEKVPFEPWIRRIMINTVIDEYRKNRKHQEKMIYTDWEDRNYEAQYVEVNEAERRYDAEDIEKMIQELPPMTQQVFNLFAIDGYSHAEIGKMLDISVGTSKWHVNQARSMVKMKIQNKNRVTNTR